MMKVEEPFDTIIKRMPEVMKNFTSDEVGLLSMSLKLVQVLREYDAPNGSFSKVIKDNVKKGNLGKNEMRAFFLKAKKLDVMDIVDGNVVWFPSHFTN